MNNQWYINSSGKNKGPHTALELQMMFDSNQINSFTLCYNKSLGKWIPYFDAKNFFEKAQGLDFDFGQIKEEKSSDKKSLPLPSLPSLPTLPEIPSIPIIAKEEAFELVDLIQDDSNYEEDLSDFEVDDLFQEEVADLQEIPALVVQKKQEKLSSYIIGFASFLVLIAFFSTFLLFNSKESKEVIFKNISFDVLKSLQETDLKQSSSKFYIKFGLDKDSEVIFGRSNLAMDAQVSAQFRRVNSDQLNDKVSFTSSAILKNGSLVLKELDFIEGERIIEGEYDVKVKALDSSLVRRIKNFIFGESNAYIFEERALLIPSNVKDYENKIASIKATKVLYETEVLTSLDQKLQTIDSILTSIALHYRLSLNKNYGKDSAKEFETRYANSAGPLLQSIILEDYESLLAKSEQKVEFRKISGDVHSNAKEISALTATLSKDLSKINYLTPKIRNQKRDMLTSLSGDLKSKINNIRKEISALMTKTKSQ